MMDKGRSIRAELEADALRQALRRIRERCQQVTPGDLHAAWRALGFIEAAADVALHAHPEKTDER